LDHSSDKALKGLRSESISGIGHAAYQVVTFNACGFGCHLRTVSFDDGSTLLIKVEDQPSGFAFRSPGNSGSHGYIGTPQSGNPQFLEIKETILSGTGSLAGGTLRRSSTGSRPSSPRPAGGASACSPITAPSFAPTS
jgi:hypothetical protein